MVKITAKEIGEMIGKSPGYVYQLMRKRGIKLQEGDYKGVIGLILEYCCRNCAGKDQKKTSFYDI